MRTMFIKKYGEEINEKKHKGMIIPHILYKIEKKVFVTVHPRNSYRVEFSDYLLIQFIYQPQSAVFIFDMIYFDMYKYPVTERKHVLSIHEIVTFK